MTRIMWEYIKDLLVKEMKENEEMQEDMEDNNVTEDMILSEQAFFKHLDAIMKMKGGISDKNCDDYCFEYEYKNVSCNCRNE